MKAFLASLIGIETILFSLSPKPKNRISSRDPGLRLSFCQFLQFVLCLLNLVQKLLHNNLTMSSFAPPQDATSPTYQMLTEICLLHHTALSLPPSPQHLPSLSFKQEKTETILLFFFFFYLEGATPTKLGPNPLNKERGPSFSKITLKEKNISQKEITFKVWYYICIANLASKSHYVCTIIYYAALASFPYL